MKEHKTELTTLDIKLLNDHIAKSRIKEGKVIFVVESCFGGTRKYADVLYEIAKVEFAN